MTTRTWTVQLVLEEGEEDTHADAVLSMDHKTEMRAHGFSRKNPSDASVRQIGDELAAARALSHLAHQLLDIAAQDIEAHTHQPVRSLRV